jgi:TetR/AcrR family transcriptional regulator, regulator of biofilm formation and stress response
MTETDGRRLRGRERRQQLIDAALVVLERDGLAGFSHRAVAAEAGVALASATYHFDGIDDLAVSAMLEATDQFKQALLARSGTAGVSEYAAALAEELSCCRGRVIAGYELYLLAARRPALRDAATAWMRAGTSRILDEVDPLRERAFLAAVGSVCLQALLADRPPTASDIEQLLEHALR